jgi:hypothetical protein
MNSNHTSLFYNLMQFLCGAGIRFHDLRTTTSFVRYVSIQGVRSNKQAKAQFRLAYR